MPHHSQSRVLRTLSRCFAAKIAHYVASYVVLQLHMYITSCLQASLTQLVIYIFRANSNIFIKYYIDKQYSSYIIKCLRNDTNVIRYIIIDIANGKDDNEECQEKNSAPKCPFCGGDFHIKLCDEEGNPHSVQ